MKPPKFLKGEARSFWTRNAPQMEVDGRLTDATVDAFVSLCLMWARYLAAEQEGSEPIKLVALSKQVQNLMGQFGMTPASRKRLKLEGKNVAAMIREALNGDDPDGHES